MVNEPGSDSPAQARALLVLSGITIAVKTAQLYGNPLEQAAFSRAMGLIRQGLLPGEPIRLRVFPDRFVLDESEIGKSDESISSLAQNLFRRGVSELTISAEPMPHELLGFAQLSTEEEEAVESEGGAKTYLDRRDVGSIRIVARDLEVTDFTPLALTELPDSIRELLASRRGLSKKLESTSPAEAFERLKELLREGMSLGLDSSEMHGAIADTVAAMSPQFRAEVIEVALQQLPDPFSQMVISQLTDGDIAESLMHLSADRPLDLLMSYAHQVVANSGGRRPELPVIVGRQMLEMGMDRQQILSAFGTSRIIGDSAAAVALPTESMRVQSAADELHLNELQAEAKQISHETDLDAGGATLSALLEFAESHTDFEGLVSLAEESIDRWIREGARDWYVTFIAVLVSRRDAEQDEKKKARLSRALMAAASQDLVTDLLRSPEGEADPMTKRAVTLLGGQAVEVMAQRLWEEPDRTRRKHLIDMIVDVGAQDPRPLIRAMTDSRWFVVRNTALLLGRMRLNEAADSLTGALSHPDSRVRREVVKAYALVAGTSSIPALVSSLSDTEEVVRISVLSAIGTVHSDEATQALIQFYNRRTIRTLRELKEALNALGLQGRRAGLSFIDEVSKRKWPPTATTRQLAKHARDLLSRSVAPSSGGQDG